MLNQYIHWIWFIAIISQIWKGCRKVWKGCGKVWKCCGSYCGTARKLRWVRIKWSDLKKFGQADDHREAHEILQTSAVDVSLCQIWRSGRTIRARFREGKASIIADGQSQIVIAKWQVLIQKKLRYIQISEYIHVLVSLIPKTYSLIYLLLREFIQAYKSQLPYHVCTNTHSIRTARAISYCSEKACGTD